MVALDQEAADRFVKTNKDARWEQWDIIIFRKNPAAASKVSGRFLDGRWGFESTVSVDTDGLWRVPTRNVR